MPITRITGAQIEQCLLNMTDLRGAITDDGKPKPITNATRNRYLVELRKVFNEAKGWRIDNPVDDVEVFPWWPPGWPPGQRHPRRLYLRQSLFRRGVQPVCGSHE